MNKDALLEEMLNELGNAQLTVYRESNETKLEESNTIWSSEYNYDEEFVKEQYQDYLDNYMPSEPKSFESWKEEWIEDMYEMAEYEDFEFNPDDYTDEELKEQYEDYKENYVDPGPVDRDKWEIDFLEFDSEAQWQVKDENFTEQIYPMIENQLNHNKLILLGSVGRWNGTFDGGIILGNEESDLRKVMGDYDEVTVAEEDTKQLSMEFSHHDGSHFMYLFTLPEDTLELAKALDYESNVKDIYDEEFLAKADIDQLIKEAFEDDLDNLDVSKLAEHKDLLKPIVNTI